MGWDGMASAYATIDDGIGWDWHGHVLTGRTGTWDAQGVRITSVHPDGPPNQLISISDEPVSTARYLEVVPLPGEGYRIYYEQVLSDESQELRTELIPVSS